MHLKGGELCSGAHAWLFKVIVLSMKIGSGVWLGNFNDYLRLVQDPLKSQSIWVTEAYLDPRNPSMYMNTRIFKEHHKKVQFSA